MAEGNNHTGRGLYSSVAITFVLVVFFLYAIFWVSAMIWNGHHICFYHSVFTGVIQLYCTIHIYMHTYITYIHLNINRRENEELQYTGNYMNENRGGVYANWAL